MRFPPPEVRELWPEPNYINPETRGPAMLIIQAILLISVTIFVAMRIYARVWITRARPGLDDVLILIAYIFGIALSACVIVAVEKYGWKIHIWDMPPNLNVTSRKISWISMILYATTANVTKASILAFYLRILITKLDKWITKITLLAVGGYYIAVVVILFAQCQPFGYYWNMVARPGTGKCMDESTHMVVSAALNLALDLLIFLIPLRSLLALKIRRTQKVHLLLLFSAGILVVVAAAMRLYYVVIVMMKTYDVPWYGYMTWLWACVEAHIGLICACVPSCRAFFVAWSRSSLGSGSRSRNMSYGPGTKNDGTRGATIRSFVEEDARGLTAESERGGMGGVRTNIEAGSGDSHSDTSSTYEREMKGRMCHGMGGVMVQMEVLQYVEDERGQKMPAERRR